MSEDRDIEDALAVSLGRIAEDDGYVPNLIGVVRLAKQALQQARSVVPNGIYEADELLELDTELRELGELVRDTTSVERSRLADFLADQHDGKLEAGGFIYRRTQPLSVVLRLSGAKRQQSQAALCQMIYEHCEGDWGQFAHFLSGAESSAFKQSTVKKELGETTHGLFYRNKWGEETTHREKGTETK